jgi:glycosyltransferase involved in cell wall biosynthesis
LLQENQYDICHFQEYSAFGGIELFWFLEAGKYGKKIFFTFHLPYFTCYKNDFRYKGIEDCNTFSISKRCVECIVATKLRYKKNSKLPVWNWAVDALTPLAEKSSEIKLLHTRINERAEFLSQLLDACTHVFIYADWFLKILNDNGYNNLSLKKIPYVTNSNLEAKNKLSTLNRKRILFVGRIEKQKGLDLLCKAMNLISTEKIQLDVFGNVVDEKYFGNCLTEYNFNFKGTVPLKDLLEILNNYDFLIMPSVFTEMYSMIIKDAFNFKLPVIASAAKGNVDAINEGKNGFLFNYEEPQDLARVIDKAYHLLENNWVPQFDNADNYENDLKDILSYYN